MSRTDKPGKKVSILLSVFLISISLFIYQVLLSRLYSAVFSYHYVFLITSFAIFGLGLGSIFAYRQRYVDGKGKLKPKEPKEAVNQKNVKDQISKGSTVLAVSYIGVFVINYLVLFVNNVLIYIILSTIPFLIGGYLFSILFAEFHEISGKLYFADLVGSGVGSVGIIFLLDNVGMLRTVALIGIIAIIPALVLPASSKKVRIAECVLPILLLAALFVPGHYVSSIEKNYKGVVGNTGKTFGSLKRSGATPSIVYSKWNAFSRTDVIKAPQLPDEMILTIDGTANAPM